MNKSIRLASIFFISLISTNILAQVTIGMGEAPSRTALLQLKDQTADSEENVTSTRGGLLLPRVRLVNINTLEPFIEPSEENYNQEKKLSTGLLVYNVNSTSDNSLYPGIYHWNGEQWDPLTNAKNSGPVKINANQSKFITLSGNQSYGLLMKNQGTTINPQYATKVSTTLSATSVITATGNKNGNDEALLLDAPIPGKANFYKINVQYVIGNNPPTETRFFEINIVSANSGTLIYQNPVVVPGKLNTGQIVNLQISFLTISDASSINSGYRIVFNADCAASQGLPNNISVKITDITRITQ